VCKTHYHRLLKHGDVTTVLVGGNKGHMKGERGSNWKGSQIGYSGAHMRVRAQRGSVRSFQCECGKGAAHWAYDHADPAELLSPEGRLYSADPNHYRPLCVSCHKKADLAVIGRG